jgi:hypothetical protein
VNVSVVAANGGEPSGKGGQQQDEGEEEEERATPGEAFHSVFTSYQGVFDCLLIVWVADVLMYLWPCCVLKQ